MKCVPSHFVAEQLPHLVFSIISGLSLFVKTKHDLDVLPPTHGALELHITRTNYKVKIWLQADHVKMNLKDKLTETIDLRPEGTD